MKDVKPEQTPKNAKVEKYTTELDLSTLDRFFRWLDVQDYSWFKKQNWFFLWCLSCVLFVIYRRWDDVLKILNHFT